MQEPRTWREFLAAVIRDTKEKQRIASEMGIDPITLTRWATRGTSPRPRSLLNRLVDALPLHREQLRELIRREFPNALEEENPNVFFIDRVIKIERYTNLLVIHRMGEVCSAAAYPLQKSGRVAGCLLILSRQKEYFAPARQALIQSYAYLKKGRAASS